MLQHWIEAVNENDEKETFNYLGWFGSCEEAALFAERTLKKHAGVKRIVSVREEEVD